MLTIEVAPGAYALCADDARFGNSTLGLVIDADGASLIDTMASPSMAVDADAEIQDLVGELGLRVKRVVFTSSRIPFTGGSTVFWRAAFFASEPVSEQLDQPVNPTVLKRLIPQHGASYHAEFLTRPVTHTVSEDAQLTPAIVLRLFAGESALNLVVHLPGADVVFLGALGSFGVTPLAFDGDPIAWAQSLDAVADLATTFVPGHGLPAGPGAVRDQAEYLRACGAAAGDPSAIPDGPWDRWTDRHFDAVNVERAWRLAHGDDSTPRTMLDLLGL
ncbi:MAG: hypothetical protein HKN24_12860 [Acidimicrobiales bacterium]|nr:hypothetical protein [Acidimicrobiales bacterium]